MVISQYRLVHTLAILLSVRAAVESIAVNSDLRKKKKILLINNKLGLCEKEDAVIWRTFSPFHPIHFHSKLIPQLLGHVAKHRHHHVARAGNLSHNAIRSQQGQTTPNLLCLFPWRRTDGQRWFQPEDLFLYHCMIWKLRCIHPSKENNKTKQSFSA